jgi:hypothetical protein
MVKSTLEFGFLSFYLMIDEEGMAISTVQGSRDAG